MPHRASCDELEFNIPMLALDQGFSVAKKFEWRDLSSLGRDLLSHTEFQILFYIEVIGLSA